MKNIFNNSFIRNNTMEVYRHYNADLDTVYEQLKTIVQGTVPSAQSMMILVLSTVRLVESVSKTSKDHGDAKRQLALDLLHRLVRDTVPADDGHRDAVGMIVDAMAPAMIDSLISAANGGLFTKEKWAWCCVCK